MPIARPLFAAFALAGFLFACSGTDIAPVPAAQGEVVSPSGMKVHATIASATLGDENCATIETLSIHILSCAAPVEDAGAKRGTGLCGGPCHATTVQLEVTSEAGSGTAHAKVSAVDLVDKNGAKVATLTPKTPEVWSDGAGAYQTWDETITSGASLKTRYTISPPPWSTIPNSYATSYRLRVTFEVDGKSVILQSELMNREPMVAT